MIAIDTNVLVRFLVEDDPRQTAKAKKRLSDAQAASEPVFVATIVLAESVWVMERVYDLGREEIAQALESLITTSGFRVSDRDGVLDALAAYLTRKGDLADFLIRREGELAGASPVFTFDKKLHRTEGFKAV